MAGLPVPGALDFALQRKCGAAEYRAVSYLYLTKRHINIL
jgi:hypothetical protein